MKKKPKPNLIVRGKNNIIISGTGNFFNSKNKNLLKKIELAQKIDLLETLLEEKDKLLKEKERTIKILTKKQK